MRELLTGYGRIETFSGAWGYHRAEASWNSVGQLVRMLADTVSKGGNLLLPWRGWRPAGPCSKVGAVTCRH